MKTPGAKKKSRGKKKENTIRYRDEIE